MLKKQKKRGNTVAASSRCSILPEDLIILILLKLPMRSIICCKCVCKSWHKLLSHPSFTNAYMSAWPPSMLPTWVIFRKWPLEILHDPKFDPLPHPLLDFLGEKVIPCASSNGLLCCSSESTMGLLYVCNPMTREFKALPMLDDPFDYIPFAGFSFSPSTGCFMVAVRTWLTSDIVVFDSSTSPSGEWRRFHVLETTCRINPAIVGHRLYFLLRDGRSMTVLDTRKEKWGIFMLPMGIDGRAASVRIVEWNDHVCLVKVCRVEGLKVWILREEEREWGEARRVAAKWLPKLRSDEGFVPLDVCERMLYVIGGKIMFVYDLGRGILGKIGDFNHQVIVTACETFAYRPTLYSIN